MTTIVIALAKDIERREGTAAAGARTEPAARSIRVERLLDLKQGVKWIGKQHCHY
jgi:hypothetical protein